MRIVVDPTAPHPVVLTGPGELTSFDVTVPAGTPAPALTAALGEVGRLDGGHVHVRQAWVREQARALGVDAGWDARFDGVLAYAASKGWVDEAAGTVRAHVVEV